ncbi:MAG: Rpn family recombination-promoting nuclease/putative transposase, partial [Treponema sp.]|uniref:Rpn family recombination-promoting nuclease/putative transposase n=1 Tax=Treponema sp. TaxID=166 RepID=UPI00360F7BFD
SNDRTAKDNFLALYNALYNTNYQSTDILKNMRLKQTMYMSFANDVSYLVDNKIIVLAEHQSTVNPNMPLRCLEYVTRLYEHIQNPRDRYSRALKKIPVPVFHVFYNGRENIPAQKILRLSDSFIKQPETPTLELVVKLININYDKDSQILKSCEPLGQYSRFVEAVRRHIAVDKEHGFENAIKECIKNDILREYLQRKSREVVNMLIAEYDYDTDIAVQREEASRIAFAEGREQGITQGISQGSRQKSLEIAKTMLTMHYPFEDICKISGLSPEEVRSISNL